MSRNVTRLALIFSNTPQPCSGFQPTSPPRQRHMSHSRYSQDGLPELHPARNQVPTGLGSIYFPCLVNPTTSYHHHFHFPPPISKISRLTIFLTIPSDFSISASNLFYMCRDVEKRTSVQHKEGNTGPFLAKGH